MDNERTIIDQDENTIINNAVPPMPKAPRAAKSNNKAAIAAGVAGVATAAAAGTAAFAMNDDDAEDVVAEVDETVSEPAADEVQPEAARPAPAAEGEAPAEVAEPAATHAYSQPHTPQHTQQHEPAAHAEPAPEAQEDSEIEVLGVVHDDETSTNIAALNVDGQEVYFIDVDNDQSFDFMAIDVDNNGDFSEDEIADIHENNITVADLGGFTDGSHDANEGYMAQVNADDASSANYIMDDSLDITADDAMDAGADLI